MLNRECRILKYAKPLVFMFESVSFSGQKPELQMPQNQFCIVKYNEISSMNLKY